MPAAVVDSQTFARARPTDRIVEILLFLTVFAGGFVFFEPSVYEAVFAPLALVCLFGSARFDRRFLPITLLFGLWIVGGLLSLAPVANEEEAVRFTAVSIFLAFTAIVYACLFQEDTLKRLKILQAAYIAAATVAAACGIVAFFKLVPGAEAFLLYDRVRGTFKDPNVFGPFLILPVLFIVNRLLDERVRLLPLLVLIVLLVGIFLSFSRGAWAHLFVSLLCMFMFKFLVAPTAAQRQKLFLACTAALVAIVLLTAFAVLLGLGGDLLEQRARLTQYYDVGEGGRFGGHAKALPMLLERPNGFGPMQYRNHIGLDAHQTYLNAFSAAGWLGGIAYIAIFLSTLVTGFRAILLPSAYRLHLIPFYAAFIGIAMESFVIDTDHWRHLYLILGAIWGLSALAFREQGKSQRVPGAAPRSRAPARVAIRVVRGSAP